ncbi:hypothetical protein ACFQNF_19830 [Iodobacter arcticus]|uniref:Uncharacterized protein n=1 Tax=Iodobacter arcticus TaxID=590593 RepID=A0ABW2R3B3_9NEIS
MKKIQKERLDFVYKAMEMTTFFITISVTLSIAFSSLALLKFLSDQKRVDLFSQAISNGGVLIATIFLSFFLYFSLAFVFFIPSLCRSSIFNYNIYRPTKINDRYALALIGGVSIAAFLIFLYKNYDFNDYIFLFIYSLFVLFLSLAMKYLKIFGMNSIGFLCVVFFIEMGLVSNNNSEVFFYNAGVVIGIFSLAYVDFICYGKKSFPASVLSGFTLILPFLPIFYMVDFIVKEVGSDKPFFIVFVFHLLAFFTMVVNRVVEKGLAISRSVKVSLLIVFITVFMLSMFVVPYFYPYVLKGLKIGNYQSGNCFVVFTLDGKKYTKKGECIDNKEVKSIF